MSLAAVGGPVLVMVVATLTVLVSKEAMAVAKAKVVLMRVVAVVGAETARDAGTLGCIWRSLQQCSPVLQRQLGR